MMALTPKTVVILETLLNRPEGKVYSLKAKDLYLDDKTLKEAIQSMRAYGIRVTTFTIARNVHRIQVNQDDAGIQKYLETKEQRK